MLLIGVGVLGVAVLAVVAAHALAGLYLAWPVLPTREVPGLLAVILVVIALAALAGAVGVTVLVERRSGLVGRARTVWRQWVAVLLVLVAGLWAAMVLYQHYAYLKRYGG